MPMLKLFISAILCTFILDMIWLGGIAKNIYAENIGHLLRKSGDAMAPNWFSAGIVYIAIASGILLFVLPKAQGSYLLAFAWGAAFGAVTYGIYDFTNFSILANWPLRITLIDFIWGIFLCGMTSLFVSVIEHWIKP